MGLSLKETVFVQAMLQFEDIGFMEWHCRVLKALTNTPQSVREVAFKTGLFQYHVRGVVQDLLGLGLIEYTRYGLQLRDEHEMLLQLVECCEGCPKKKSSDYEAAFEVVVPRVMALERKFELGADSDRYEKMSPGKSRAISINKEQGSCHHDQPKL